MIDNPSTSTHFQNTLLEKLQLIKQKLSAAPFMLQVRFIRQNRNITNSHLSRKSKGIKTLLVQPYQYTRLQPYSHFT